MTPPIPDDAAAVLDVPLAAGTATATAVAGPASTRDGGVLPERRWGATLAFIDLGVAFICANAAVVLIYARNPGADLDRYQLLAQAVPLLWVATLAAAGAYDRRFFGTGVEEFRRIANSGAWLITVTAAVAFAANEHVSRGFVLFCGTATIALTLLARYGARRSLHRLFRRGTALHRAIVIGDPWAVDDLVRHISRVPAGIAVVDSLPAPPAAVPADHPDYDKGVEVLIRRAQAVGATMMVVARGAASEPGALRHLSWRLEGTGIDLTVAPSVTDVAGPRIRVKPVGGLPLLHVKEPVFEGGRRVVKETFDRAIALVVGVAVLPLAVAIAVAIKAADRGPIFYRQERIGIRGRAFTIWKFRTMRIGADVEHEALVKGAGRGPALFKLADDPRVTHVGRLLRRYSLDELPQLWNVIAGTMSLVGPRPQVRAEVETYDEVARRRLLVKPGITGLWQVSGRSNLDWAAAIRLDLYYIDNWSIALDLLILWKTSAIVMTGDGAC